MVLVCLASRIASSGEYSLVRSTSCAAARYFFPRFMASSEGRGPAGRPALPLTVCHGASHSVIVASSHPRSRRRAVAPSISSPRLQLAAPSVGDRHAHRASRASDDLLGCFDVVRVEVRQLGLRDLPQLLAGKGGDLCAVRRSGAFLNSRRLLDQLGGWRRLGDEGERPVLVDSDLNRYDVAALRLGGRVVLLAELHDVDAVLAERWTDRRRRRRLSGVDLQLDDRSDLLLRWHGHPLDRRLRASQG